jgi:hypothetical protein
MVHIEDSVLQFCTALMPRFKIEMSHMLSTWMLMDSMTRDRCQTSCDRIL